MRGHRAACLIGPPNADTCGGATRRGGVEQAVLYGLEEGHGRRGLARGSLGVDAGCGSGRMRALNVMSQSGLGRAAGGWGMHGLPERQALYSKRELADVHAEPHWLNPRWRRTCPDASAAQPVQLFANGKREVDVELGHPVHCAVSGGVGCIAGPCRARRQRAGRAPGHFFSRRPPRERGFFFSVGTAAGPAHVP